MPCCPPSCCPPKCCSNPCCFPPSCLCPRCCSRVCICKCSVCGCATCNGMQLCLKCTQKRASLTRRQCYLPRTSNCCIRPCYPPQCVDTYAGCRSYRARYDEVKGITGCCPQLKPRGGYFACRGKLEA